MKKTAFDRAFDTVNYILVTILFLLVLYPLFFTLIASISDPYLVVSGKVFLYPKGANLGAYRNIFINDMIWTGYRNSILYTACGILLSLALTIPCAFGMAYRRLPGKNILMAAFVFRCV